MIRYGCLAIVLALFSASSAYAQFRVTSTLTVTDNAGGSQMLTFGIDPAATNGLDKTIGESECPPLPPSGAFDARFIGSEIGIGIGEGTHVDYREGTGAGNCIRTHELRYQMKSGGTQVTIAWALHSGVTGQLQDIITGTLIDVPMQGTGSYTVASPGVFDKLKLTAAYDAAALPVELSAFTASLLCGSVRLTWTTATEVDNFGFSIERTLRHSGAAETWIQLGFIDGHGTSAVQHAYEFIDRRVPSSGTYAYRLKQTDRSGAYAYSRDVEITTDAPDGFRLGRNYPNPFNPSTSFQFSLPSACEVSVRVYDLHGALVCTLAEHAVHAPGMHTYTWDASRSGAPASGIYFARVDARAIDGGAPLASRTMKLVLLK